MISQALLILIGVILIIIALMIAIFIYYVSKGSKVLIDVERYKLKCRLYMKVGNDKQSSAILFLSGWNPGNSSITTSDFYAGFISERQYRVCMTVALRGMGSEGDINNLCRIDFLNDAIAAYDYLANISGVDKQKIFVVGESFGGYLSSILTTKRSVNKLVLRVPTDFPNDGFGDKPQIQIAGNLSIDWKNKKHNYNESFALNAIHEFNNDILIVASGKDKFVPQQTIDNYLSAITSASKLKYVIMKKAGHGLYNPLKFLKLLNNWMK